MIDLKEEFETFIERQVAKSPEDSLTDLMATPYCRKNGELGAMFHMFQFAYHLGEQHERAKADTGARV